MEEATNSNYVISSQNSGVRQHISSSLNTTLWWSVITGAIALHLLVILLGWFLGVRFATTQSDAGLTAIEFVELDEAAAPETSQADVTSTLTDISAMDVTLPTAQTAPLPQVSPAAPSTDASQTQLPSEQSASATPQNSSVTASPTPEAALPDAAVSDPAVGADPSEPSPPAPETIRSAPPSLPVLDPESFDPTVAIPNLESNLDPNADVSQSPAQSPAESGSRQSSADSDLQLPNVAVAQNPIPAALEARILSIEPRSPADLTDQPVTLMPGQDRQTFRLDPTVSPCLLTAEDRAYLGQPIALGVVLQVVADGAQVQPDYPPEILHGGGSDSFNQLAICLMQSWVGSFVPPSNSAPSNVDVTPELSDVIIELEINQAEPDTEAL